jgi:hypothetical protein
LIHSSSQSPQWCHEGHSFIEIHSSSSQSPQWCHEGHRFIEIQHIPVHLLYCYRDDLFHVINCTDTYLKLGFNCNLEDDTKESEHTAISQTSIFPCALLSLLLSVNIDSIACPSSFHEHKQPWWQGTPSLMSLLDTPHRSVDDQASFHSYIVVVTCIGTVNCSWTQRLIGWCFAIQWEVISQVSQGNYTRRSMTITERDAHTSRQSSMQSDRQTGRQTGNHTVI